MSCHLCCDGWIEVDAATDVDVAGETVTLLAGVTPCPTCRPDAYRRLMAGHYDPDHDPDRCPECATAGVRKTRPPNVEPPPDPTDPGPGYEPRSRKDLE